MTLLASLASMVCSLSLSNAAPAVAVVPAESVTRVEVISPVAAPIETTAILAVDFQLADDPGESGDADAALEANEPADITADNAAADDEQLLPADVVIDEEEILPADVVADVIAADDLLPADVVIAGEEEFLPADVVADDEAGLEDAIAGLEAETSALAEAEAASSAPRQDQEIDAPPATPAGEEDATPSSDPPADGEAAS